MSQCPVYRQETHRSQPQANELREASPCGCLAYGPGAEDPGTAHRRSSLGVLALARVLGEEEQADQAGVPQAW